MKPNSAYDRLLHEVCVGLGYCGSVVHGEPRHVDMYIPENGPVSADEFVVWVYRAEGMNPDEGRHSQEIRDAFVKYLGARVVDAQALK